MLDTIRRLGALGAAGLLLLAGCGDGAAGPTDGALYLVRVEGETFRVKLESAAQVATAEEILRTGRQRIVQGDVVAGDGGFNASYSWHLEPSSVRFVEQTIELCDGLPSYVEEHRDEWIRDVGQYCPWMSTIVRRL